MPFVVDTKGAIDFLHFVPEDIHFGDNVVPLLVSNGKK